jgi:hypothetical protein
MVSDPASSYIFSGNTAKKRARKALGPQIRENPRFSGSKSVRKGPFHEFSQTFEKVVA